VKKRFWIIIYQRCQPLHQRQGSWGEMKFETGPMSVLGWIEAGCFSNQREMQMVFCSV